MVARKRKMAVSWGRFLLFVFKWPSFLNGLTNFNARGLILFVFQRAYNLSKISYILVIARRVMKGFLPMHFQCTGLYILLFATKLNVVAQTVQEQCFFEYR